ncbi:NUDIX domain-containing protein [uncultured Cardiobacterium sp.]|uniref:NUDIX hydrolase n=1 Tax=uncultured Cardiobacterium sp. TaxID=417619 RepID=UPI00260E8C7A|nr:NUDIX domain-containing protein [uncultured Cardiobacterium sp.]
MTPTAFPQPYTTVDVVIFTVADGALRVLLSRRPPDPSEPYPATPCLPGGYIDIAQDATLYDCALRKLREKTGFAAPYLEQLGSWGSAGRDPRGWTATHVYFALVPPPPDAAAWPQADAACAQPLAFDHNDILRTALARLRSKVEYTSLPAFLLAEPFTLPQLQRVYEIILDRALDKSAFRKRTLDAGLLVEDGMTSGGFGRNAMGYRLAQRDSAIHFPRPFRSGEQ